MPSQCRVARTRAMRLLQNPGQSSFWAEVQRKELVGAHGSGTIFFSFCNLACVFCQNYRISHCGIGREVAVEELADMMIGLQARKCHNINLVSPGHVVPQVVEAVFLAAKKGLTIPIVYNTNGYDLTDTLKLLEGIVDIYMPDIKFSDDENAKISWCKELLLHCEKCGEGDAQAGRGPLTDERGIAYRGLWYATW